MTGPLRVLVRRINPDPSVALPAYALPGDAGADIVAATRLVLAPGERAVIGTGIAIALPDGYAAFVHPRSGLAARCGLGIVNSPGTIDSGYRGEIKVIAINHGAETIEMDRGERIAQLVFQRFEQAVFVEVDELPASHRAAGGLGSSGGAAALTAGRTQTPPSTPDRPFHNPIIWTPPFETFGRSRGPATRTPEQLERLGQVLNDPACRELLGMTPKPAPSQAAAVSPDPSSTS